MDLKALVEKIDNTPNLSILVLPAHSDFEPHNNKAVVLFEIDPDAGEEIELPVSSIPNLLKAGIKNREAKRVLAEIYAEHRAEVNHADK